MLIVCLTLLPLSAVQAGSPKDPEMKMSFTVTEKAQISKVITYKGKWNNKPAVWILLKILNITDHPVQYKVRCRLHDVGLNRGARVHNAAKPVKPGTVGTAKFPFPYSQMPKNVSFVVEDVPD